MQCLQCDVFDVSNGESGAISVAFVIIDIDGNLVHEFVYSGDDVGIKFIRYVLHCEEILVNTTKFNRYMEFITMDQEYHKKSTTC